MGISYSKGHCKWIGLDRRSYTQYLDGTVVWIVGMMIMRAERCVGCNCQENKQYDILFVLLAEILFQCGPKPGPREYEVFA